MLYEDSEVSGGQGEREGKKEGEKEDTCVEHINKGEQIAGWLEASS